jgi:cytoplasmic tRNA 2-thiolation protein 1
MAKLVPGSDEGCGGACSSAVPLAEEEEGGCGSANGRTTGGEMANMEQHLSQNDAATENGLEVEITSPPPQNNNAVPVPRNKKGKKYKGEMVMPRDMAMNRKMPGKQVMGQCKRCGYLSSQEICKACVLLEGLNKSRPKNEIVLGYDKEEQDGVRGIADGIQKTTIQAAV